MEANEFLPDFDDFEKMAADVSRAKAEILTLRGTLAQAEAVCMREALVNSDHWIGGKRPSMAYCEKIVKELGNTEEDRITLRNLRMALANKIEAYQLLQHLITLSRDKLDLYRTISANTRRGFLDG